MSANPEGGEIVAGTGSIDQSGVLTQINQNSGALAINWDSFNVGANEIVQFIQPDGSAVALNRIVGGDASAIFGRIDANGTVFLVNTAGVMFAEGAQINVGNLVVSGLDMTVDDFMDGNYELAANGLPGAVINHGTIAAATGGSVVLVGGQVVNTGLIRANYGRVTLAGAEAGYLDFDGNGLLRFEVTGELKQQLEDSAAVTNSGTIEAAGGEVIMQAAAARGVFDTLVNNEGIIVATGIDTSGGEVRLVAVGGDVVNSGSIDVSSVSGNAGTVTLSATDGKVVNTGAIRAVSQQADAGAVLLTATNGNVETSGEILATSGAGEGGFVILDSNADTVISAGLVDVGSVNATGGTIHVLGSRVIVEGPSRLGSAGGAGGGTILIGGSYQGQNASIRNASRTFIGSDVEIDASAMNSGSGGTVIVWSDDYTWFYGTVSARGPPSGHGGFVEVSSHGTLAYAGRVDLRGGTNGTLLLDPTDIQICAACGPTNLDNSGGNPATFSDANNNGPSPSRLSVSDLQTQLGLSNVIVTTASTQGDAGNIVVQDSITWAGGNTLTLTANNHITINTGATITATGTGSLTLNAGTTTGIIQVNAAITLAGGSFTATGSAFITDAAGTIAVGAGNISISANTVALGAALSGTGTLTLQPFDPATTIGLGGAAGVFSLDGAEIALFTDGFSSILIGRSDGTGGIAVNAVTFNDAVTLRSPSGGTIAINGTLTGAGNASVTLAGNTALTSGITTADQSITITGNVTVAEAATPTLTTGTAGAGNISISGTTDGTAAGATESLIVVSGSGTITFTGAVGGTTPIALTLQSDNAGNTGAVTFSGAANATALTTFGHGYNVVMNGGGTFTALVEFLNTGSVTLGNDVADAFTFNGGLETAGNATNPSATNIAGSVATSNDAITLGPVTLATNTTLDAGTGTLTLDDVTGSTFNLTLTADEIDLGGGAGSITGSGAVLLQPATATLAIEIAGAGGTAALDLVAADVAALADGHSSITIGQVAGEHAITVNAVTFTDPVTIQGPVNAGSITVDGTLSGTGNASITLLGTGASTTLNADITTEGDAIFIDDVVVLGTPATITLDTTANSNAAGAAVTITGEIDDGGSASALVINGGTGGAVDLQAAVGATTPVGGLTITGAQVDVANVEVDTGNIAVTGSNIDLNGDTYVTSTSGTITFTGPVDLEAAAGPVSVMSAGGAADSITFTGAINDTGSDNPLAIDAGAGSVTLGGAIGGTGALSDLDVTGATINLNGGSIVVDAGAGAEEVRFDGAVTLGSNVSIDTDGANDNNVRFTSTVNADDATANNRTLTITAGTGTARFDGAIGTTQSLADLDVTATTITFNDAGFAVFDQGGNTATFNGGVVLGANVTFDLDDTTDNSIVFNGTINADDAATNDRNMVVLAGSGTATYNGDVGTVEALGDMDTTAATINLNASTFLINDDGPNTILTFTGAVVLGADTVTISTDSTGTDMNISFTSTINADNAGTQNRALVVNAGTGNVTFGGIVGGTQALADLDVTGTTINLNTTGLTVNDGTGGATVTFTGAVALGANVAISTNGTNDNHLSFTSTVNADNAGTQDRTLAIDAGTATVTFGGAVGDTQALADLDVTAGTININGASVTANDGAGGATVTFAGAVVLGNNVTISTNGTNNNILSFTSSINADDASANDRTLTIDVGGDRTLTVSGNVGDTQPLAGLTIVLTNGTTFAGSVNVTDGAGTITLTDSNNTIAFQGGLSATALVTANQGYNVSITGTTNTITNLVEFLNTGTVTLGDGTGDTLTFNGGVETAGNGSNPSGTNLAGTIQTSNDAITLGTATLTANTTLSVGTATVTTAGITGGANNLTITADEINFGGAANSITGTGAIVLQPATTGFAINIAGADVGAGALDLLTTDLEDIQDGHSSITIGHATDGGLVTVAAVTFSDPITIRSGGTGDITIAGAVTTIANQNSSVTLTAGSDVTLNAWDPLESTCRHASLSIL